MNPYELNWQHREIVIKELGLKFAHRLRRPDPEQVIARSKKLIYATEDVSKLEATATFNVDEANALLYDGIIAETKGFDFGSGRDFQNWHQMEAGEAARIPLHQKNKAIHTLYAMECELEEDEEAAAQGLIKLRFDCGVGLEPYAQFWLFFTYPEEKLRAQYDREYARGRIVKGSRKNKSVASFNLRVAIQAFDQLLHSARNLQLDGAEMPMESHLLADAKPRFCALIDPIIKELAMNKLFSDVEAELQD